MAHRLISKHCRSNCTGFILCLHKLQINCKCIDHDIFSDGKPEPMGARSVVYPKWYIPIDLISSKTATSMNDIVNQTQQIHLH